MTFHSLKKFRFIKYFVIASTLIQCSQTKNIAQSISNPQLEFLNEYVIPNKMIFDNTAVGGLSSLDYDSASQTYAAISDDRSEINPARYYTFKIGIQNDKIDTVIFQNMYFLKNANNQLFPSLNKNKKGSVDPEALRMFGNKIIWSDEGLREENRRDTILVNPRVFLADSNGDFIDTFPLPNALHSNAGEWGPRNNGAFEGLTISPDNKFAMVSVEEPLLQDGPRAGLKDSSAIVRLLKFDLKTRKVIAQYAYSVDPVAHPVFPPSAFRINGISDIMYLDENHLLVVERSYSSGSLRCTIKVFITDLSHAEDISKFNSLKGETFSILPKKLLLNTDTMKMFIDNIEGVTFGSMLSDGSPSLIFISDNNFNPLERTQLLLFKFKK